MEEKQNSNIDFSHYLDSRKTQTMVALSNPKKINNKNKIYIAIIIICFLAMAALWWNYFSQ